MKNLVIYYSLEGNTKLIAENIAKKIDADILELKTKKEYHKTGFKKYFWGGNPPHSYIVVLSKIKLLKRSLKKKVLCNFPEWHSISITCN